MQHIVVLGGLGDVYLVAALYHSFCWHHGRADVELVIKSGHAPVVNLFAGVPYIIDDEATFGAEANVEFQENHDNTLWSDRPFFAHSCMLRSRVRVDQLTTKPDITQADMFRMLLQLSPSAPLSLPHLPWPKATRKNSVIVLEANTWPDTQPTFYPKLVDALRAAGRDVWINDKTTSLDELLPALAAAEWVIGPQCGLMSILVTGRFPCRKTLCVADIDGNRAPSYWADDTYPYAYVTKFAGNDFDVEEYKVADHNHDEVIAAVLEGANANRLWPHDPAPTLTISAPLSPGDFLDRLACLSVKMFRFSVDRRVTVRREYQRYRETYEQRSWDGQVEGLFARLVGLHAESFDLLETVVPDVVAGGQMDSAAHSAAVRMNKVRVELKQRIDRLCHASYSEVKSYYDAAEPAPPPKPVHRLAAEPYRAPPRLVEEIGRTNLVAWKDEIYAVPQAIGPVDLMTANLALYPQIKHYPDIASARQATKGP
jgi:hypothetical protein